MRSEKGRIKKRKWHGTGWWEHTSPEHFVPVLDFAGAKLDESTWKKTLWNAMGRERLLQVKTNDGLERVFASEIHRGHEWERRVTAYIPNIGGSIATLEGTRELQDKVRQMLNQLMRIAETVDRDRSGKSGRGWIERTRDHDLMFRRTGIESNYVELPWDFTHYEEWDVLRKAIHRDFNVSGTRSASVNSTCRFVAFDDEGEDASITLGWYLLGLVEVVFREERRLVRQCPYCEKYFLHQTLKEKRFCSSHCRYNSHNKGLNDRTE